MVPVLFQPKHRLVNPKTMHFHYTEQYLQDQNIPNIFVLVMKTNPLQMVMSSFVKSSSKHQQGMSKHLVSVSGFLSIRNIGQVSPKNIYFHYLKKYFLDQSVQKANCLILKTEVLVSMKAWPLYRNYEIRESILSGVVIVYSTFTPNIYPPPEAARLVVATEFKRRIVRGLHLLKY